MNRAGAQALPHQKLEGVQRSIEGPRRLDHFVSVKTIEQQGILCVHRLREGFKEERTACINRIRGLLAEFGIVLP